MPRYKPRQSFSAQCLALHGLPDLLGGGHVSLGRFAAAVDDAVVSIDDLRGRA